MAFHEFLSTWSVPQMWPSLHKPTTCRKHWIYVGTVLMGESVHNQRIEWLWKDVYGGCLFLYYQLFYHLEDCALLNPCSEVHLLALHYVFLPRIQDSLDHFRQAYIQHPISSARNHTPVQLWTAGLIRGIEENRRWADELYQVIIMCLNLREWFIFVMHWLLCGYVC